MVTDTAGSGSGAGPKSWQLGLIAFPVVALATLFLAQFFRNPDYTGLLWRDPMGLKMLLAAGALLVVGAGVFLGGCVVLNLLTRRSGWGTGATVAQVFLAAAWLVFSVLPAVYVVMVGPAAIQIQRNLLTN